MLKFTIFHMYPDAMNLYGDFGNVLTLVNRAKWREIEAKVIEVKRGDKVDFQTADLIFLGGGQDRGQKAIAPDLLNKGKAIKEEVEKNLVALTICGGYQLFGKYFKTSQQGTLTGISVFDVYTLASTKRCIGNIVVDITKLAGQWAKENSYYESNVGLTTLVGFENHSGLTYLDKSEPLGNVLVGYGNTDNKAFEGAVYKNAYGTYLHGPILPKNPHFADHLILEALRRRYDESVTLSSLDDSLEHQAHYAAIERAKKIKTAHL